MCLAVHHASNCSKARTEAKETSSKASNGSTLSVQVRSLVCRTAPLTASEPRAGLLDAIQHLAIVGLDPSGLVTAFNAGAERLYGCSEAAMLGRRWLSGPTDQIAFHTARERGCWEGEQKRGGLLVRCVLSPVHDCSGNLSGFCEVSDDITALRDAETRQAASEQRLRAVLDAGAEGFMLLDAAGKVQVANAAAAFLLGASRDDLLGQPWDSLQLTPAKEPLIPFLRVLRTGERSISEVRLKSEDGCRSLRISSAPLQIGGRLEGVVVSLIDTTSMASRQARISQARWTAELSRRLLERQEQERRQLARELHDEIGGSLTALRIQMERDTAHASQEALALITGLIDRTRNLSLDLRPAVLDDLGLLHALLLLVQRLRDSTGLTVTLRHRGLSRRFPQELETGVYRIVQEALTNVARHSGRMEALVKIEAEDSSITASISDDGRGFEAELAEVASSTGLSSMRERSLLLGGTFEVVSQPGAGCSVRVQVPILELGEAR